MRESPLCYLEVKGFPYCQAASVLPPKGCGQSNFPLSTLQCDKRDVSGHTQNWQPDIYTHFTEWLADCADIWKEPELNPPQFLSQLKQCLCFTFLSVNQCRHHLASCANFILNQSVIKNIYIHTIMSYIYQINRRELQKLLSPFLRATLLQLQ